MKIFQILSAAVWLLLNGKANAQTTGSSAYPVITGSTLSEAAITQLYNSISKNSTGGVFLTGSNNNTAISKVSYSDYVVQPNKLNPYIEFHDHVFSSGNSPALSLSTFVSSASIQPILSAASDNGTSITLKSIYKEAIYGSGNIPWATFNAPSATTGVNITLNTTANLFPNNTDGSFAINNLDGNQLSLRIVAGNGVIGWSQTDGTSLSIAASKIMTNGALFSSSTIETSEWLRARNLNSNVTLSSTSLTFSNQGVQTIIGSYGSASSLANFSNPTFLIQTANQDILFNALRTPGLTSGPSFSIAFNGQRNAIFTAELISFFSPFVNRGMRDSEIEAMKNVEEGTEVYSLDRHAKLIFNGTEWREMLSQPFRSKSRSL
jgi:hypothetical protein